MIRPLAVSMGEPAGIGPDLIVTAWSRRFDLGLRPFVVFGDIPTLDARAKVLGIDVAVVPWSGEVPAPSTDLPVASVPVAEAVQPGILTSANGSAVIEAIHQGMVAVAAGTCSALVTAPIHKATLYECGLRFPGHTEYLGNLAGQLWPGQRNTPVMMLSGPDLRTVPLTIHMPLSEVTQCIEPDLIAATLDIVDHDLRHRFGLARPRIVVAGLNPHAGEGGALGREDDDIIGPAIKAAMQRGINARGPLAADTLFHAEARETYDVAVCMYHDQALIPAKMLAFHEAVNVTLGLPFVRTSPDHGTALSLAGVGSARIDSFVAALRVADEMVSAEAGGTKTMVSGAV